MLATWDAKRSMQDARRRVLQARDTRRDNPSSYQATKAGNGVLKRDEGDQ